MWKRSMVVISGAVLAVSLPTAAFALIAEGGGASVKADQPIAVQEMHQAATANGVVAQAQTQIQVELQAQIQEELQAQIQDEVQVQVQDDDPVQDQVMDRKQLRLHIETGPPEGTEPTQTRVREHQQLGTANPDAMMGNQDHARGNPDAPMLGDGTGECIHDGDPIGTGPHGPGGGSNG